MKKPILQRLAQKVQLEIPENEMSDYLETFQHLEKLLVNFQKEKISPKIKPMTRIKQEYLTLSDLKKLSKKYTNQRISKKILQTNAETTPDGFILFKQQRIKL